jgi:hypothetical protein
MEERNYFHNLWCRVSGMDVNGYDSVVKIKGASAAAAFAPFVEVTGSIAQCYYQ